MNRSQLVPQTSPMLSPFIKDFEAMKLAEAKTAMEAKAAGKTTQKATKTSIPILVNDIVVENAHTTHQTN